MNWYKRAQLVDPFSLNDLLDWLSGSNVKLAQVRRSRSGGRRRTQVTEEQQTVIRKMYEEGKTQADIARTLGLSTRIINNSLIRSGVLKPGKTRKGPTGQGIISDKEFIDKVKELRKTTHPATGKPYNKAQIARELGVSYQTVDRVIAYHDPQTPNELANYVSYEFWGRYSGGIKNTIANIPAEKRARFVSDFVDSLFESPQDRASAKEALFRKLKMRNEMLEGPEAAPPPTQLMESGYAPDYAGGEPEELRRRVEAPQQTGAWQRRQERGVPSISERYDPARIDAIIADYAQSGYSNYNVIARKHGISMSNLRQILEERGLFQGPSRSMPVPIAPVAAG